MNSDYRFSSEDLINKLTPELLRTLKIISMALAIGVLGFGFVVVFMYQDHKPADNLEENIVGNILFLSTIQGCFALFLYYLSFRIFNNFITRIKKSGDIYLINTAYIVRFALIQAPAYFGLVICFMAITNGVIYQYPIYWLNAVTAIIFVGYVFMNIPTKEKIAELFRR